MLVIFWVANFVLTLVDYYQSPEWLYRFKLQPNVHIGWKGHIKVCSLVAVNQLCLSIPSQILFYPLYQRAGVSSDPTLPSFGRVFRDLLIVIGVEEVLFYYTHRLMHVSPFLYRNVHSLHHTFNAPVGTASMYAHPIEFMLSNALPIMCGPLLSGCHVSTMWLWVCIAILSTINGHSGYAFPFTPFGYSKLHDLHHRSTPALLCSCLAYLLFECCTVFCDSTFQHNYGAIGLCDWLHGTRRWDAPLYEGLTFNVISGGATNGKTA